MAIIQKRPAAVNIAYEATSYRMRVHKDGYIQDGMVQVWISDEAYHRATHTGFYMTQALEEVIEEELGIELTGNLTFRIIERNVGTGKVLIQIDSDWIQPTKA